MTDILTVTDLKKYFVVGRSGWPKRESITVKAVDGISFTMGEGETLGLVGESGSGKSTVAYITVGMYSPTSGSLKFRDQDLFQADGKRPIRLKKDIQIVYQDPGSSLNPRRTIKDILKMPLQLHQPGKNRLEQIVYLLDIVDMPPEYMYKYPYMLSGGEKQIVAVARALATDPSLVILDEPTSALDVSVQAKTINLLLRLQQEFQLTYLFITHDLSMVRHICDRVAVMYLGRVVEMAPVEELYTRSLHPYTQALLSAIPVPDPAVESRRRRIILTGDVPNPAQPPPGCTFHTRCSAAFDRCRQESPRLEEVSSGHSVSCFLTET